MKKKMMGLLVALIFGSLSAWAQVNAKYCLTYDDFLDNRWVPVDSLVEGRTKQLPQLRATDDQYKILTGDKEADGVLKKVALVVEYGGHLYVNCRNLRCNDIPLDVNNYTQAYRYEKNKLLVVARYINGGALLASLAGDVVSIVAPLDVAIPAGVASTAIWLNMDKLNNHYCYLIDTEANAKGKIPVTRLTDEVMEKILAKDPALLGRYKAVEKKRERQSASNILPVLMEKGLIKN